MSFEEGKRLFWFRILVISGSGLPDYTPAEDTFEVGMKAIFSVTGLNMQKEEFHTIHRHGRSSERIFAE